MVGFNRRFSLLYRQAQGVLAGRRIQTCLLEKNRPSAFYAGLCNKCLEGLIH